MKIREMIEKAKSKLFHRERTGKDVSQNIQNEQNDAKNGKMIGYTPGVGKRQNGVQSDAERQSTQNMSIQGISSLYEMWSEAQMLKSLLATQKLFSTMDRAQQLKFQMPNNKRRRRGIPMVRRQAYLQAEKNRRKRARKK